MLKENLVLENDQILLRPITEQDFSLLQALANDPSLWRYFTQDLSIASDFFTWVAPAMAAQRLQFVVIEIGWTWLGRAFHGTGINQQMKIMMVRYCFEVLQLKRVEVKTDVLNQPARKALAKMGFVEEGILRSHTQMTHNRRRDTIYYSLLETEYEGFMARNSG